VTKATVETKNWLLQALRAGLLGHYVGLEGDAQPAGAAGIEDKVGTLPHYMAGVVDKGVARALASYRFFYGPSV
jgi:hypothetical protein